MKPHRSACSLSDFSYPAPCRVAYSIFFSLFLSVLVLGLLYMLDFCLQIPLCPAFLFSLPIPSSYFIEPLWRASHLHFLLESPTVLIPTIPSYSGPFFLAFFPNLKPSTDWAIGCFFPHNKHSHPNSVSDVSLLVVFLWWTLAILNCAVLKIT